MVRFVRREQTWIANPEGNKLDGRGAYLCSPQCARRVTKNKRYPGLASAAADGVFKLDWAVDDEKNLMTNKYE
ncbi:MAG: DUF448 domain-containing protein [Candidatus Eremiobacteraeota bacterium]|nr:DUF448 domain-containing protein [Candidatus Eremiobacteraeota bacterium]